MQADMPRMELLDVSKPEAVMLVEQPGQGQRSVHRQAGLSKGERIMNLLRELIGDHAIEDLRNAWPWSGCATG